MRKAILSIALALVLLFAFAVPIFAATTQDVTVTATPAFITISNSPGSFDFDIVQEDTDENTGTDYFTITNGSTVAIDINIKCDGWSSGGTAWTYGAPAANTGQLKASSGEGGTGGSGGSGTYDITVLNGTDTLLCDGVATTTNPQWELELDAPTSFTHGDAQQSTVTLTASAD